MHPAGESFLFEQRLRAAKKGQSMVNHRPVRHRPRLLVRINKFFQTLNHVRRIRIEVTFDYQEARPESASR